MTDKERNPVMEYFSNKAKNWPKGDRNLVDLQCTGIERGIPPESTHEDAKKALEYCKQARRFGATDKGFLFLMWAVAARKDFELFDDAVKAEKFAAKNKELLGRIRKTKMKE